MVALVPTDNHQLRRVGPRCHALRGFHAWVNYAPPPGNSASLRQALGERADAVLTRHPTSLHTKPPQEVGIRRETTPFRTGLRSYGTRAVSPRYTNIAVWSLRRPERLPKNEVSPPAPSRKLRVRGEAAQG